MVFKHLIDDLDAYMERDPAASSRIMVVTSYPGFHAVVWFRLAHWLWSLSLIHISEPTRRRGISYAVFCLKKKSLRNAL